MLSYIQGGPVPQLCRLFLIFAVISIPLNTARGPHTSVLAPLRTTFVPFETSVQSPVVTLAQFSIGAPSGKRIALGPNAFALPFPQNRDFASYRAFDNRSHSRPATAVTGRSPPFDWKS
jgi:hypothetical protein